MWKYTIDFVCLVNLNYKKRTERYAPTPGRGRRIFITLREEPVDIVDWIS